MEDRAIIKSDQALTGYSSRDDIGELANRVLEMLPNAKQVGKVGALALAQVAVTCGLNPFTGEIWAIPQKGGTFAIMTGIRGLRRAAHQACERDRGMYTTHFRVPTEEELSGLRINAGDIARACDITISGETARKHREITNEVPRYTGIGVYRQGEPTRMNPLQVARKRAEADGLKQAFDLPFGVAENGGTVLEAAGPEWDAETFETGLEPEPPTAEGATEAAFGEYEPLSTARPPEGGNGGNGKEAPESVPPERYATLPAPATWTELWGQRRYAELGYKHQAHALNVVRNILGDPDNAMPVEAAWQVLIDHQLSKLVESEPAESEPEPPQEQAEMPF